MSALLLDASKLFAVERILDDAPNNPNEDRRQHVSKKVKKLERAERQLSSLIAALSSSEVPSHPGLSEPVDNSKKRKQPAKKDGSSALSRPPHMDRNPVVDEAVAAKIASHELWILVVVRVCAGDNFRVSK